MRGAPRDERRAGPCVRTSRCTAGQRAARPARAAGVLRGRRADGARRRTLRALEAFQALAAANPDDFDSRVWLGRLLTRLGRRAEAIELLRDVITRSPRQVDARVALGAALLTSGRVEDAYAVVQDAEALEPKSADVLALKGRILRHLGRPSEAYARWTPPTRSARATRTSASSASAPAA